MSSNSSSLRESPCSSRQPFSPLFFKGNTDNTLGSLRITCTYSCCKEIHDKMKKDLVELKHAIDIARRHYNKVTFDTGWNTSRMFLFFTDFLMKQSFSKWFLPLNCSALIHIGSEGMWTSTKGRFFHKHLIVLSKASFITILWVQRLLRPTISILSLMTILLQIHYMY